MQGTTYSFSVRALFWPRHVHGIYKIICIANGKFYIGKTESASGFMGRWIEHRTSFRNNKHRNPYMQKCFNKYGEDSFYFQVVECCSWDDDLLAKEWEWMQKYDRRSQLFNILTYEDDFELCVKRIYTPTPFSLINPLGENIQGPDLRDFCKRNSISERHLKKVLDGSQGKHHGYSSPNPEFNSQNKSFKIISPKRILFKFDNIRIFCENNNLNYSGFRTTMSSSKFSHYFGWHLPDLPEEKQIVVDEYLRKTGRFTAYFGSGKNYSGYNLTEFCKQNNYELWMVLELEKGLRKKLKDLIRIELHD
jgi:hypothetical protein